MTNTLLGRDIATNKPVAIDEKDRSRGVYIIGKTGSGKSVLIQNMALQDIEAGMSVCVLDPHGDLIEDILSRIPPERINDVILINPMDTDHPFGLNLYECVDPTSPTAIQDTISGLMQIYEKVFEIGRDNPLIEQVLRATAYTLLDNGMTMTEIPLLLLDEAFRKRLVKNVTNPQTQWFWRMYESLSLSDKMTWAGTAFRKVDEFVSSPIVRYIVGQAKTTLNFRQIMDEEKILLVELPGERHRDISSLIGAVIINQLLLATLSRKNIPEKKRKYFCLYADEFQQFAIQSFGTLLVEARKYHVCTTLANQVLGDIEEEIRRKVFNAGTLVVLRITSEDADIASEFDLTPPDVTRNYAIPSDPIYELTNHTNKYVQRFEQQYIRRLLEGKAFFSHDETYEIQPYIPAGGIHAPIRRTEEVLPKFNFRPYLAKEVSFDRNDVLDALNLIQTILYQTMIDEAYDWTRDLDSLLPIMADLLGARDFYYFIWKRPVKEGDLDALDQEIRAMQEGETKNEAIAFSNFFVLLLSTCFALKREPIRVRPSHMPDDPIRMTFSEMEKKVANELVHLPIGQAMVKSPSGEYRIETILPNELDDRKYRKQPRSDEETKQLGQLRHEERVRRMHHNRPTALANTIRDYCKSRAEVEEEIRRRQEPPPPSVMQKYTV